MGIIEGSLQNAVLVYESINVLNGICNYFATKRENEIDELMSGIDSLRFFDLFFEFAENNVGFDYKIDLVIDRVLQSCFYTKNPILLTKFVEKGTLFLLKCSNLLVSTKNLKTKKRFLDYFQRFLDFEFSVCVLNKAGVFQNVFFLFVSHGEFIEETVLILRTLFISQFDDLVEEFVRETQGSLDLFLAKIRQNQKETILQNELDFILIFYE